MSARVVICNIRLGFAICDHNYCGQTDLYGIGERQGIGDQYTFYAQNYFNHIEEIILTCSILLLISIIIKVD